VRRAAPARKSATTARLAALLVLAAAGVPATAEAESFLISRTPDGGFPDGPAGNATFSQDRQIASLLAFDSTATNLADDGNGPVSDVFLVRRRDPLADRLRGLPWRASGPAGLVSRGLYGRPANGPSYAPDLDGDQVHDGLGARDGPHCVAFVSSASNLVRGDTNGLPDAFVRDLRSGRTTRVSVNARGRQANGATYEVEIDGGCDRVAFTSDASNLALTRSLWRGTRSPEWRSAVTSGSPPGRRQVYVRFLRSDRGEAYDAGLRGLTFLASAARGRAGNGPSYDVALGDLGREVSSGDTLAFTSEATNLAVGDRAATPDVYRTSFRRRAVRAGRFGPLRPQTELVSVTRAGAAGNGPSTSPTINDNGRFVAFATEATDVLPCTRLAAGVVCDDNGFSDVARADLREPVRRRIAWASASAAVGQPGNGPSARPDLTRYGSLFFESDASNLQRHPIARGRPVDGNGTRDVFFWSEQTLRVSLQSLDSDGEVLPPGPPSGSAATSAYNNYVLWETANPLVDLPLARRGAPPVAAGQVYLHYVGPR
jgi:hypothetical protein